MCQWDLQPVAMVDKQPLFKRRIALKTMGSFGLVGLAGCLGDAGGSGGGTDQGAGNKTDRGAASGKDVSLQFATEYEPSHLLVKTFENAIKKLENKSDGQFSIDLSTGGAYGSLDEIANQIRRGGLDGSIGGSTAVNTLAPEYAYWALPFTVTDYDKFGRYSKHELMGDLNNAMAKNGNQRIVGPIMPLGTRQFISQKPVRQPSDVKGVKLRLPAFEEWIRIWEKIGADISTVSFNEQYSALETGVVNAVEGTALTADSFSFYEVASHFSLTSHGVDGGMFYINEDVYQGLDDSYKSILEESITEAIEEGIKELVKREEQLINSFKTEHNMTIISNVDVKSFVEKAQPAIKDIFKESYAVSYEEWNKV